MSDTNNDEQISVGNFFSEADNGLKVSNPVDELAPTCKDKKWEEFNLKGEVVTGIYSVGFERPSHIQNAAIPAIMNGENIRAKAQSGTGKTGAFVIGTLHRVDERLDATQAIIVVSTREIASQIHGLLREIGKHTNISSVLLTGGSSRRDDKEALLAKERHVVVGTPGRISDMLAEGWINAENIHMLVLDEADELCKGEFMLQIKVIYDFLDSSKLQVCFFSATYSVEDLKTIECIVNEPKIIEMEEKRFKLQGIKYYHITFDQGFGDLSNETAREKELLYKINILLRILQSQSCNQILVFIKRKKDAVMVSSILNENSISCDAFTADLDQAERTRLISQFKTGEKRILVTSDLCKRGVDIQGLGVVICLDVPHFDLREDFIHRVGRTGRYGRRGVALHILNTTESKRLKEICDHYDLKLYPLPNDFKFGDNQQ